MGYTNIVKKEISLLFLFILSQGAIAQKKTSDTLVLKTYYKAFTRKFERNLDLIDDTTRNSFLLVNIRMQNYALKSIFADFTDSGIHRLFKEAKVEELDSFFTRICKITGIGNCTLVQPVFLENDKMNNSIDIRQLPGFYNTFCIYSEPKILLENIKLSNWGKVH